MRTTKVGKVGRYVSYLPGRYLIFLAKAAEYIQTFEDTA